MSRGPPFESFPCWRPLLVRAAWPSANATVFGRASETKQDRASSLGTWQLDERGDGRLLAVTDPSCTSRVRHVGSFSSAHCSSGWSGHDVLHRADSTGIDAASNLLQ